MSNRRKPRLHQSLDTLADQLADQRVPGGCADCAAYQTFGKEDSGVYAVRVHHDAGCPWLGGVTR